MAQKITRDATVELLKDMIKVNEYNGTPLGCDNQAVDQVIGAWYPRITWILPDTHISYPAGHVAGPPAGIRAEGKSLLYTGDFCLHDTEILVGCNPQYFPNSLMFLFRVNVRWNSKAAAVSSTKCTPKLAIL